ncbi:hypothetical protein F0562_014333 [Nyssa sinensis]|uniref:Uncharacterized protein n=1 Tax=Nyssa sinensis TaxID=561372 RepID=A0A5J4ZSE3_9ASTE|nr:hypothetical protein F0562_014333 [Nyssa sinensis]
MMFIKLVSSLRDPNTATKLEALSNPHKIRGRNELWLLRHQAGQINGVPEASVPWKKITPLKQIKTTAVTRRQQPLRQYSVKP